MLLRWGPHIFKANCCAEMTDPDIRQGAAATPLAIDIIYNIEIFRYMDITKALAALNNPVRRNILSWLKDRSNFPPALPEHADLEGVCVAYIQAKAELSQSTISNYMGLLRDAGLVVAERHGQWTFYRRDEEAIAALLRALGDELSQS